MNPLKWHTTAQHDGTPAMCSCLYDTGKSDYCGIQWIPLHAAVAPVDVGEFLVVVVDGPPLVTGQTPPWFRLLRVACYVRTELRMVIGDREMTITTVHIQSYQQTTGQPILDVFYSLVM